MNVTEPWLSECPSIVTTPETGIRLPFPSPQPAVISNRQGIKKIAPRAMLKRLGFSGSVIAFYELEIRLFLLTQSQPQTVREGYVVPRLRVGLRLEAALG